MAPFQSAILPARTQAFLDWVDFGQLIALVSHRAFLCWHVYVAANQSS
jgi:hypothetical protein